MVSKTSCGSLDVLSRRTELNSTQTQLQLNYNSTPTQFHPNLTQLQFNSNFTKEESTIKHFTIPETAWPLPI